MATTPDCGGPETGAGAEVVAVVDAGHEDEGCYEVGNRTWRFRGGSLVVHAYEDFLAALIGGVVTTASVDLARFVAEGFPEGFWRGRSCVELGAGCGLVSGTLAQLGARVVATELEQFLPHLQWNLDLNTPAGLSGRDAPQCQALNWDDEASRAQLRSGLGAASADVILAANCAYADTTPSFVATLAAVAG
eukprot:CAMPEP_0179274392 /NCGR_PEP_ID=MMETSP0797-20121207/33504_1 /TAXON_ID=47934 /ORGANISM="Dinophysis acuminata, Strain DAEP01" /LENGTH=190 /DNA_ID=CAMNT_0020982847 /DNA_START=43 /DNA_END=611 /DNA_ORIENTATION=+